jgi:hypothetical protein
MKSFGALLAFIDTHFIDGIFVSLLIILLVKWIVKSIDTKIAMASIVWIIIGYSILSMVYLLLIGVFNFDANLHTSLIERATGKYKIIYVLMLLCHSILPLVLLIKRFRTATLVFLISVLMNIGWLFESFIIHLTSFHRDYSEENSNPFFLFDRELLILEKGAALGIVALILGNLIAKYKHSKATPFD